MAIHSIKQIVCDSVNCEESHDVPMTTITGAEGWMIRNGWLLHIEKGIKTHRCPRCWAVERKTGRFPARSDI